jgi:hypothetical protein
MLSIASKTNPSTRAQVITRRTYNRPVVGESSENKFETWEQTVDRVIDHQRWLWTRAARVIKLTDAQESELQLLRSIYLQRIGMCSGRTLWLGGTEVSKRREASQFNCSFFTVQNVFDVVDGYWLLLQGCGVGFKAETGVLNGFAAHVADVEVVRRGVNERYVKSFNSDANEDFLTATASVDGAPGWMYYLRIGDSAEAWAKAVGKLLAMKHKVCKITLDFTKIRPAGERLKGYGWISSGDSQLCQSLVKICGILNTKIDCLLDEIDILDIMNHLGMTLTSRRSAEICLMDYSNPMWKTFATIKKDHWIANPQRSQSNNSIMFWTKPSRDQLSEVFDLMVDSGGSEPGFINAENARRRAPYFKGCNPCFSGDTLIATADGRVAVSIKQLADEGKDVPVYSFDPVTHEVSIKWGRNPRVTGYDQKLFRVHFQRPYADEFVDVTSNHKFMTTDGRTVLAKDLVAGDSIPRFKKDADEYVRVHVSFKEDKKRVSEHRMIAEFLWPEAFAEKFVDGKWNGCCKTNGVIVHHKDENKFNNLPDNLEVVTASEHSTHHNKVMVGSGNPMFRKHHSDASKKLISNLAKKRFEDPSYKKMVVEAMNTPEILQQKAERMTAMRKRENAAFYDSIEVEAERCGLKIRRDSPEKLVVIKTCEFSKCGTKFETQWGHREKAFCNNSCYVAHRNELKALKEAEGDTIDGKSKKHFFDLAMLYEDMLVSCEDGSEPTLLDFEKSCKERGFEFGFDATSPSPWIAKDWSHFKSSVECFNHRVAYVEELPGSHTVYNITVDVNHTLVAVTMQNGHGVIGVGVYNCGEILLGNVLLTFISTSRNLRFSVLSASR